MKSTFDNVNFLVSRNFFSWTSISKMGIKMNFGIGTKNHAADPEIRFLTHRVKVVRPRNGYADRVRVKLLDHTR